MNDLDNCIKEFSLIFTKTLDIEEFCRVGFDLDKQKVDYNNCISLYDIVEKFNMLYVSFKKEYSSLNKFELGKHVEIGNFIKYDDTNFRRLLIYIDDPFIINKEWTDLYLVEKDGNIGSFITNGMNPFDKDYYCYDLDLDKEKVKDYLDLFDKYSIFVYLYYRFRCGLIFSNGTNTLFTNVENENSESRSELLDDLKEFKISIGANYFLGPSHHINIYMNLGNNFGINLDRCKLELFDKLIDAKEEDYLKILKSIYLNAYYLNEYCDRNSSIKRKKLIDAKTLIKLANNK